ncbi:hypothetical protein DOY81_007811 [Sarcophaga bullata]|nr:hypothetical protein DOY81_007811 [Sarcophaga bullata]
MSDKFNVIDHATFERMQQSSSRKVATSSVQRIRNSKYKRISAADNFNLLQFVKTSKPRRGTGLVKKDKICKRIVDKLDKIKTKKGKKRENGKLKKPTRLKKSILQYRQKKREQAILAQEINCSIAKLEELKVSEESENQKLLVASIYSRKFRSYCNCCKTPEVKEHCEKLVRELNFFQRRAYAQNAIKARAHTRFVVGFRQAQNYLRINKVKLVIIATDCEYNEGDVTLDETIERIKTSCNDQQIPIVFAFQRRELAYILYKKASISCIALLDYDGARETFSKLLDALKDAQKKYESLLNNSK